MDVSANTERTFLYWTEYSSKLNIKSCSRNLTRINKRPKKHGMYLDVRIDSALDYDETTQAISESYGYRWMEAANHYNNDEPKISAESKYYIYKEMDVITFNLAYE